MNKPIDFRGVFPRFYIFLNIPKSSNEIKQFSNLQKIPYFITEENFEKQNFWNLSFDKGRIKNLVSWFLKNYGQKKTIQLVENLKNIGFEYATKAGISLGIDDLKISPNKAILIAEAEKQTTEVIIQYKRAQITGVERFQRLIDIWHRTSENLKQEVINYFEITDLLNPVYMMAFSGARGNISQVRQLVGMRGLMADPKGQILDFPIRSNFREGLTLTEYLISSYGARKGIVDTALRTANAGYLTRRLVDVAQHVIVSHYDCGTHKGILITDMKEGNKIIYSLQNRLIGRVLAQNVYSETKLIARRNQEVSSQIAGEISKVTSKVLIRSTLTCETRKLICQLCYGWSLGQGKLVSIGDAVGVIAAQSIGEPGTQLTMRTFHTGGVFSSDVNDQIIGPYDGLIQYSGYIPGTLVRTPQGKIAFLTKAEGSFVIKSFSSTVIDTEQKTKFFKIPPYTLLFCRHNETVYFKQVVAQICSASTQNKQRDDAEQSIHTELQGQVYMDRVTLIEQTNHYGDTNQQSWDWGYIWILSGKIYEVPVDSYIFPKFGDFINSNSILNQIQWKVPDQAELTIRMKPTLKSLSLVGNDQPTQLNYKLPNKRHQLLLQNITNLIHSSNMSNSSQISPLDSEFTTSQGDKLINKMLRFNIEKEKFNRNFLATSYLNQSFKAPSFQLGNLNFTSSTADQTSLLTKKSLHTSRQGKVSFSLDLNFKRPVLLFDTNKFNYKKIGYFFKVNIPVSLSQLYTGYLFNQANFVSKRDKFFLPVNLNSSNPLLTNTFIDNLTEKIALFERGKLENSFDWKNLSQTFLTWFPAVFDKQGSGLINYEVTKISPSLVGKYEPIHINLEDPETFILKERNPILYSQILNNISKFPSKNLNYNQLVFNSKMYFHNFYISSMESIPAKKLWFFSGNQEIGSYFRTREGINKKTLLTKNNLHNTTLSNEYFKKYKELRWKNSKTFHNKEFSYRGRIFWIQQKIYRFIALESNINPTCLSKKIDFNNWRHPNSILYYNLTRQGKKLPVYTASEGFVQIYRNPISTVSPNHNFSITEQFLMTKSKKLFPNSFLEKKNNKLIKSLKNYNKNYYIALKFKLNKFNSNMNVKKSVLPKNFKKLTFLNVDYFNKKLSLEMVQNLFNNNKLAFLNVLKLKNNPTINLLISQFKFSFLNLTSSVEKQLILNKIHFKLNNLILQLQSGWCYIPNKLNINVIKYHKSIVPLGKILMDDIMFDTQLVYVECLPIKSLLFHSNLNFINIFFSLNSSEFYSFKQYHSYKLIKKRHTCRYNVVSSNHNSDLRLDKFKSISIDTTTFLPLSGSMNRSFKNLKWVSNLNLRKFSNEITEFFPSRVKHELINFNNTNINNNTFTSEFIIIIKKVNELNIQDLSYYKTNLYNSQITNFQNNFSYLLKDNYHTIILNKQAKNLRLISKFPNVDYQCEPIIKGSLKLNERGSFLSLGSKKILKTKHETIYSTKLASKLNLNSDINNVKFSFYNNLSNLLYFKLHFTNNSTFQIYYKKPIFTFNYLASPNFFTVFSFATNFMYKKIFSTVLKINDLGIETLEGDTIEGFFKNRKLFSDLLFKITLFFASNISNLIVKPLFNFSLSQQPFYFFNSRFFLKTHLNQLFSISNTENVGLTIASKKSFGSSVHSFPKVKNSFIFTTQIKVLETKPFAYSSFLSPYEGELLFKETNFWNTTFQKNRLLILTKNDLISFNLENLFLSSEFRNINRNSANLRPETSIHNDILIKFTSFMFPDKGRKVYQINNLLLMEPKLKNVLIIGEFIAYGDQINKNIALSQGGQVVHLSRNKLTIRKGQSIFLSSHAILHAYNGDLIDKNFPVVTLPYQKLKAGDIVQGIPKIEQFFEARITRRGRLFRDSIPNLLKGLFKRYKLKYSIVKAVQQSFYKIQQILVDGVQRVYRSQGVTIADKHIEIIVKQMTCKVKIINGGQTGFFPGELVDLEFVEQINKILMNKVYYEPVILGITKASLEVESFLSAASFQQTTRMLSKAAISRKKDFLKGLKENVIVGNLIPSGTGYLIYLQDTNKDFKI